MEDQTISLKGNERHSGELEKELALVKEKYDAKVTEYQTV